MNTFIAFLVVFAVIAVFFFLLYWLAKKGNKNNKNSDWFLDYEHGRWKIKDTSTSKGVFLTYFISGCFLSLWMIFACSLTKYSDDEKNGLKWFGAFCGSLFQFFLLMFIFGIVLTNAFYIIFGLLVSVCVMVYVVKKYKKLYNKELYSLLTKRNNPISLIHYSKEKMKKFVEKKTSKYEIILSEEQKLALVKEIDDFTESEECSENMEFTDDDIKKIDEIIYNFMQNLESEGNWDYDW